MKSWEDFRVDLLVNVSRLNNPACLKNWKAGVHRLGDLTKWLHHRSKCNEEHAIREWRLLEEGFGREVAKAYRDGMKLLWRNIRPERPKRKEGGPITTKRATLLAFGAIGLEAAEDADWAVRLSDQEAKCAIAHACLSEQGCPDWIDDLVKAHPRVTLPAIRRQVRDEWLTTDKVRSDFLNRYARAAAAIQPAVQKILFGIFAGREEPSDLSKLERGIRIIRNLSLDDVQERKLLRLARTRFEQHASAGREDFALHYLALLFVLSPNAAVPVLEMWLSADTGAESIGRAERTFGFLFDPHDLLVSGLQQRASVSTLEHLLRLAYHHVRPEHDAVHKGVYSRNGRDHAQDARNLILRAIVDSSGPDAYFALRRVAADPDYALRADRFRELARGMAERDTETLPWTPNEALQFERQYTAPIKTGEELLRLVMGVLQDIQHALDQNDVSSRPLLRAAKSEDEVRNWLMEQMNFRSKGRFNAYREAEVAGGRRPDVIVSSTSAPCEVAMEVKHGGKTWTLREYDAALLRQLANDYLRPASRRHGIFVVSNHGTRHWRDPETNEVVIFDKLISRLSSITETLMTNATGAAIAVRCFGIDASDKLN
jgi:hypothetical protein